MTISLMVLIKRPQNKKNPQDENILGILYFGFALAIKTVTV